jgi:hypothetical protein
MYPQAELALFAKRKRELLGKIKTRREDLVDQVTQVLWPVLCAKWRGFLPALKLTAMPLGYVVNQKLPPKTSDAVGGFLRWAPLAVCLFRSMRRGV